MSAVDYGSQALVFRCKHNYPTLTTYINTERRTKSNVCASLFTHTYIFLRTLMAQGGGGGLFIYSVLRALRAIGTLSHNHSLNRRRHEKSLIRREATKVSGQEMATQKRSYSARSGIATGVFLYHTRRYA